ncbi:hypothetical protein AMTRI_Chr02g259810 [Amborella trichopoda]
MERKQELPRDHSDSYSYNSMNRRNDGLSGAEGPKSFHDTSYVPDANPRPPEFVLSSGGGWNYSVQTGEEFEFMQAKAFIPPSSVSYHVTTSETINNQCDTTTYQDFQGILGIQCSGSDVSMFGGGEKGRFKEREGKAQHEFRTSSYHRLTGGHSIEEGSNRGGAPYSEHGYISSGTSDGSVSGKMKFLCSYGGRILPRPSDGKLRYVGGVTRIISIRRDITWEELMRKILTIYDHATVIKYQLPGEELDALVSVSCDEDIQNMLEEYIALESIEGSQTQSMKLRIFLFSASEFDEGHLDMRGGEGSSELQYVVAVNGIDSGMRKSPSGDGLGSASSHHLDQVLSLDMRREKESQTIPVPSNPNVPSSVPTPQSSCGNFDGLSNTTSNKEPQLAPLHDSGHDNFFATNAHDIDSHRVAPPSVPSKLVEPSQYPPFGMSSSEKPLNEQLSSKLSGFSENIQTSQQRDALLGVEKPQGEVVLPQQRTEYENMLPLENELISPTLLPHPVPQREIFSTKQPEVVPQVESSGLRNQGTLHADLNKPGLSYSKEQDLPFATPLPDKGNSPVPSSQDREDLMHADGISISDAPIASQDQESNNDFSTVSAEGGASLFDYGYYQEPYVPQRVFRSERIPRSQMDSLNRLSKSDDSINTHYWMVDPPRESIDPFHEEFPASSQGTEPTILTTKAPLPYPNPSTLVDGLMQFQGYKDLAESISQAKQSSPIVSDHGEKSEYQQTSHHVEKPASIFPADEWESLSKHQKVSASGVLDEPWWGTMPDESHKVVTNVTSTPKYQGDNLIDVEDNVSSDLLSDIFSRANIANDPSGISVAPGVVKDEAGVSLNMPNHEPQRWSFFRNLAKDISLIDQDHMSYSSPPIKFEGVDQRAYDFSHFKGEGISFSCEVSQADFDKGIHREASGMVGDVSISLQTDFPHSGVNLPRVLDKDGEIQAVGEVLYSKAADGVIISTPDSDYEIIKNSDLEELRELGSGTFGTVYHGKWRGTDVAIKRIKKSCFTGRSSEQERLTQDFWREAAILSKLHHPNVVAFYGVVHDGPGGTLATVTEFMVNGSLRHVLLRKDRALDRRKRLIIAMDAAFGMEYLHSKNIVHFDLKCDNLLVNMRDPHRPICKVGDFGLSKIKANTLVSGGVRGTLPWMAPELLNGSSSKVSEKVDVFSFGIVMWEILTGEEPYAHMHYGAIIGGIVNNTLRPPVPGWCDPEWRRLMEQCWAPDPAGRPSFTEIASRLRMMSDALQAKGPGYQAHSQMRV